MEGLAKKAARARVEPGYDGRSFAPVLADAVAGSPELGRLVRVGPTVAGVVLWRNPPSPVGLRLSWLYLARPHASARAYRHAVEEVDRGVAPVAFVAGPLAGISRASESEAMRGTGFAPYGRSEMVLDLGRGSPGADPEPRPVTRAVRPDDEPALARLHEEVYRDHFDRWLFLRDLDPRRDAFDGTARVLRGEHGTFLPFGSTVVEENGRVVGAVLTVKTGRGPMIVDVGTAPDFRGRGIARAAIVAALRGLRAAGETLVRLNVTEGNEPAVGLYLRLGFVRSLGPSREWCRARFAPPASRVR